LISIIVQRHMVFKVRLLQGRPAVPYGAYTCILKFVVISTQPS